MKMKKKAVCIHIILRELHAWESVNVWVDLTGISMVVLRKL